MKKINFAFGIHNHQPIGNFEHVFEDSYQKGYLPFLKIIENYPDFKVSLHYSGVLFEWIKKNHPEALDLIKRLVKGGQVKLLTGSYYESILPVIPDWDKIGQIQKLTQFIQNELEIDPSGMWLSERVWEPHLPKILSLAGIKFVILDDTHFKYSGLSEQKLLGYYVTEEQGYKLNLFPISKTLRYTIPFKEPEVTIDYFKEIATEEGNNLIVYADDGEKFGIWPKTYQHCYQDMWLERFLDQIEKNKDWICMLHFSQVLERLSPLGRVYLPTASYAEMSQWTLLPSAFREYEELEEKLKGENLYQRFGIFVRGGFWRNFLAKYPESNHLHKRVLDLSYKIKDLETSKKVDEDKLLEAKENLWRAQCNDPYWHGVFGGLYLTNLRDAVWKNFLEADKLLGELSHKKKKWIEHKVFDLDKDGKDEILIETPLLNFCFLPHSGGTLVEFDFKPKSFNLLNILSRREEGYHEKIKELSKRFEKNPKENDSNQVASIHDLVLSKEEDLDKYLTYDWYRRGSLLDHFLGKNAKLDDFSRCQYSEQGDFVNQHYQHKIEIKKDILYLTLLRDGWVWIEDVRVPINLAKKIVIKAKSQDIEIFYNIKNNHSEPVFLWFGVEFNFGMLSKDSEKYVYVKGINLADNGLTCISSEDEVSDFGIKDSGLGLDINLKIDKSATLWRFPVLTVSLSESGFEKNYQSTVLFPNWKMELKPQEIWELRIVQRIEQI